jgi:hypothetical protein
MLSIILAEREGWLLPQHAVAVLDASICARLLGARTSLISGCTADRETLELPNNKNPPT